MMLFLNEHLIFRKPSEQLGSVIGDTIEQIYSDREVGAKNEGPVPLFNHTLDVRSFVVPTSSSLDQRDPGRKTGLDITANSLSTGEIDSNVGTIHLPCHLISRESRIAVIDDSDDLVPIFLSQTVDEFSHRAVADQSYFHI